MDTTKIPKDFLEALNDRSRLNKSFWLDKLTIAKEQDQSIKDIDYWIDYLNRDTENAVRELNNKLFIYREKILGI